MPLEPANCGHCGAPSCVWKRVRLVWGKLISRSWLTDHVFRAVVVVVGGVKHQSDCDKVRYFEAVPEPSDVRAEATVLDLLNFTGEQNELPHNVQPKDHQLVVGFTEEEGPAIAMASATVEAQRKAQKDRLVAHSPHRRHSLDPVVWLDLPGHVQVERHLQHDHQVVVDVVHVHVEREGPRRTVNKVRLHLLERQEGCLPIALLRRTVF